MNFFYIYLWESKQSAIILPGSWSPVHGEDGVLCLVAAALEPLVAVDCAGGTQALLLQAWTTPPLLPYALHLTKYLLFPNSC